MLRQCEQAKKSTERDISSSLRRLSNAIRLILSTEFAIIINSRRRRRPIRIERDRIFKNTIVPECDR